MFLGVLFFLTVQQLDKHDTGRANKGDAGEKYQRHTSADELEKDKG